MPYEHQPGTSTQTVEDAMVSSDVVTVQTLGREYVVVVPDCKTDYIQGRLEHDTVPYEYEMLADLVERFPEGGRAIDVGANIGNHTLFLAAHGFEVVAYEPNTHLAQAVARSARLNGFSGVHVRTCAVGLSAGSGEFVELLPENLGAQQVALCPGGEVEIVALDDEPIPSPVDVLKIDVEGSEYDVLRGARRLLRRDRPAVYVECQDVQAFLRVDRWMSDEQYVVHDLFNATPTMLYLPVEKLEPTRRTGRSMARIVATEVRSQTRIRDLTGRLTTANQKYRDLGVRLQDVRASARLDQVEADDALREAGTSVIVLRQRLDDARRECDEARAQRDKARRESAALSVTLKDLRSSATMRTGAAFRAAASSPRGLVRFPAALWRASRGRDKATSPRVAGDRAAPATSGKDASQVWRWLDGGAGARLRVAAILDDSARRGLEPEWDLTELSSDWSAQLRGLDPDLLLVDSSWCGSDAQRHGAPVTPDGLRDILGWCREHKVPTASWDTDPARSAPFLDVLRLFDHVFTPDLDRVADYKRALGHDRVWLLPFAVQPKRFNPLGAGDRRDAFVVLGSPGQHHQERSHVLTSLVSGLEEVRPVEIYDPDPAEGPGWALVEALRALVVGRSSPAGMPRLSKEYAWAVDVSSARQSSTLVAPSVLELLASGTVVVSGFSRAVQVWLGDAVVCTDSGAEALHRLEAVPAELRRLAGLRAVLRQHTYRDRAVRVWEAVTGVPAPPTSPSVLVVASAVDSDGLRRVLASLARQVHPRWQATVVVPDDLRSAGPTDPRVSCVTAAAAGRTQVAALPGDLVAVMVADDYYGDHYLEDLALGTRYSDATVLGKAAYRRWVDDGAVLEGRGLDYREASDLAVRRSVVRRSAVETMTVADLVGDPSASWEATPQVSLDALGYCADVPPGVSPTTSGVDGAGLGAGASLKVVYDQAARIPPRYVPDVRDTIDAKTLATLFAGQVRPKVKFKATPDGLVVTSTLAADTHDYLYAGRPVGVGVGWAERGDVHLAVGAGLDVRLALRFVDSTGQRLGSTVVVPNSDQKVSVPPGTTGVTLGLRVRGSGHALVENVGWQPRDIVPDVVPAQAEALVVTNLYPAYDDLYCHGFVHSRVRSYQRHGLSTEVVCIKPRGAVVCREFEGVGVAEAGSQAAARIVAAPGRSVMLVHFLDPLIWSALSRRPPGTGVVVWVHGSEIQPWWRRAYNYTSAEDLDRAKRLSDRRLDFWRKVLAEADDDVHFVFVSQYFLDEVQEDLGVTIGSSRVSIIHNPIDAKTFAYHEKCDEDRLSVLSVRPYASRKYANDLAVDAVLRLSTEPEFDQMSFTFVGDGPLFDETTAPLRGFANVTTEKTFLQQRQIAQLHRSHGIFLVPTRMDAQGVSRDEAMASGLVPVTNAVAAVPEFVDDSCGELAPPEDADGLAEGMLALVRDPERFQAKSRAAAARVRRQSEAGRVVAQELEIIRQMGGGRCPTALDAWLAR